MELRNRFFILLFGLFITLCSLAFLWQKFYSPAARIAKITVDGAVYKTVDLSAVTNEYTIEIIDKAGHRNVILVQPGQIQMQSADCPDQLCVKQGSISTGTYPIVCLPNKVIISLENEEDMPDAVTGR